MEEVDKRIRAIVEELARVRGECGVSAYALSSQLGKNKNYIAEVENGRGGLTLKTLLELCEILEIDPRDLF